MICIGGAGDDRTRDLLTASLPSPFKTNNLCVFLQEIPPYSYLCNLQMQAKCRCKQRGFTSVLGYRKIANERRLHDPFEKGLDQLPVPRTRPGKKISRLKSWLYIVIIVRGHVSEPIL
jgi:hypothetical protein